MGGKEKSIHLEDARDSCPGGKKGSSLGRQKLVEPGGWRVVEGDVKPTAMMW